MSDRRAGPNHCRLVELCFAIRNSRWPGVKCTSDLVHLSCCPYVLVVAILQHCIEFESLTQ